MKRGIFLLLMSLPFIGGCGTLCNLEGKQILDFSSRQPQNAKVFGGVDNDFTLLTGVATTRLQEPMDAIQFIALELFALVDLPFSAVGDIFTIPKIVNDRFTDAMRMLAAPKDETTTLPLTGSPSNTTPPAAAVSE